MKKDTVLVTGFAQLPRGTTLYERFQTIGIVLVINTKTETIEDSEFTFVADLTKYYLTSLLKDYDLKQGIGPLTELIKNHVLLPSQGAIIQALRSAWDRYQESKAKVEFVKT